MQNVEILDLNCPKKSPAKILMENLILKGKVRNLSLKFIH